MNSDLIKKINTYFHDEESAYFSARHAVRIKEEVDFYSDFFKKAFLEKGAGLKILDIGSGTGLVSQALPPGLGHLTCSDISARMLDTAKKNMRADIMQCVDFTVCDAENLPFKDGSFDIVTCNAAMHHFPSTSRFASEAVRVLAKGGYAVIGFEANRAFWSNRILSFLYRALSKVIVSRREAGGINYGRICDAVNKRLIDEGVVSHPLKNIEMLKLVDIHSPNSGEKIDTEEGFDPSELLAGLFKGYKCEVRYHYSGLPKPLAFINRLLFPDSAPKFSLILKKS